MSNRKPFFYRLLGLIVLLCLGQNPATGALLQTLSGHVPEVVRTLVPTGRLPANRELHLAIGVPLKDAAGLEALITEITDPSSPNYRHYLTPDEFASRFSAPESDYAALCEFARTNGFTITRTHGNRMLLEVTARAADVERAFHLKLNQYQHPVEARTFFAPDTDPTMSSGLAVADIQGLNDYVRPHPHIVKNDMLKVAPQSGTAPDGWGSYFGDDFRNAYAPGTALTGAGQTVGLLQFDGFYSNDIAAYAAAAGGGRTNIVIETVLVGGNYDGTPTANGNIEVSLDIEMAMSMAPGLDRIVVFEASPTLGIPNTLLAAMVTNTAIKQFSCSWGWSGGPNTTTDNYFKQMIAQGQSFFDASGDSDAFTVGRTTSNGVDNTNKPHAPASSPYITVVGGTTLTMVGAGLNYASESVWNWNNGSGSSGGVSSYYGLPTWQSSISMTANHGSTSKRNIPDVALTADNVYVISDGTATGHDGIGGTSCAAPLWAGFMALVNQQAASLGHPAAGFINPAIYAIGKGQNTKFSYASCFHDTTSGNNYWTGSPARPRKKLSVNWLSI